MDKKLLTPGPLTTSLATKKAMMHDWGSRDQKVIDINNSVRESLITLICSSDNKIQKLFLKFLYIFNLIFLLLF